MARLIHENVDRKARMPLATLAKAIFRKRSLYYPLPGYRPTVQAERTLRNGQVLRVEASLPKDVFGPREPVEVTVVVHQTCTGSSKKQPKLAVTQVKAKLFQSLEAQKNGESLEVPVLSRALRVSRLFLVFVFVHGAKIAGESKCRRHIEILSSLC